MDAEELTVAIFHRPLRGAWLIDKSNGAASVHPFSELAQACCEWWEGRNSLLIRVKEEGLDDHGCRLLGHHDPDEVVSLHDPSPKLINQIDRIVDPLVFSKAMNVQKLISHADFQLHTIASLPSAINLSRRNQSLFTDALPSLVLFAFRDNCPPAIRNCAVLNFGTYAHSIRADGNPDFGLFAERGWKDLPHRVFVIGSVEDFAAALDELTGDWTRPGLRFVTPMQLAGARDDIRPRWPTDERYHVFIGESFEDADLFWHQPIIDGSWRLCSQFRFYLPTSLASDPKLQVSLQKWLWRATNAGSSNHKGPLFLSKSLQQDELQRIADALLQGNKLGIFGATAEHWDNLRFPEHSDADQPTMTLSQVERSESFEIFRVSGRGENVHTGQPEILNRERQDGRWMADVFIQAPAQPGLERASDFFWRLPRRRAGDLVRLMFHGAGRLNVSGYFSVALGSTRPMVTLRIPRQFDLFAALIRGTRGYSVTTDLRRKLPQRESIQFRIRVSDKGRWYREVVRLFGSLGTVAEYFGSVLWRRIFSDLASEKASTDKALETQFKGVLTKIYRTNADATQHKDAARRLMDKIQGRSKEVRLTIAELNETLKRLSAGGTRPFAIQQNMGNATMCDDSECPYNERTLTDGLSELMSREVITAGFEITCLHCGSTIWLPIDRATQRGECPDCGTQWTADAEMPWRYELTGRLKRAVQRSGGGMPVLLAIWRLFYETKGSFLWQPNLDIYRPDHENGQRPWGELDIVCLIDAKFVIGEVKQSIDDFAEQDFDDLHKISSAICPDVMLLVFMDGDFEDKSRFAERLKTLQSQLSPETDVQWRKVPSTW